MFRFLQGLFARYRVPAAFLSAAVMLLVAGYAAHRGQSASGESASRVQHTYEVLDVLDQMSARMAVVQSSSRGYALSGNDSYLATFEEAVIELGAQLAVLKELTADNAEQQSDIPALEHDVAANLRAATALVDTRRMRGLGGAVEALGDGNGLETLETVMDRIKGRESVLLAKRQRTAAEAESLSRQVLVVGTLVALLITGSAGVGVMLDNRRRRRAETALYVEKELAQVTLGSIGEGVIRVDRQGRITFLNRAAEEMTGWRYADAIGQPFEGVFTVVNAATGDPLAPRIRTMLDSGETLRLPANAILVRRGGGEIAIEDTVAPIRDLAGNVMGAVKVFRDVSDARETTRRLEHSAHHDVLTGLPNRSLLDDRIRQSLAFAARHDKMIALLFMDLDGFKPINDRHGHAAGDLLLRSVADRLRASVRDCDTVSRLGGDEFVVLLGEIGGPDDAGITARRILRDVSCPHLVADLSLHITASIGISIYPEDGHGPETLLRHADLAMYVAKSKGRNVFAYCGGPDARVIDGGGRRAAGQV